MFQSHCHTLSSDEEGQIQKDEHIHETGRGVICMPSHDARDAPSCKLIQGTGPQSGVR